VLRQHFQLAGSGESDWKFDALSTLK
jgi:hypothetical protein